MQETNGFFKTPISKAIWEDRYALKDKNGKILEADIEDTFKRVAIAISSKESNPELWRNRFYEIMANKQFCPAGRILAQAGTHYSQLLNCFVLPFRNDSLEEIMHTASDTAVVQKFGGGVGLNYSVLRPEGSHIKGVNGRSCGVIGFLSMMSTVSEVIEQGGSRRGANLGLLHVDHPDVWDFISYKTDHNWDAMLEYMGVKDQQKWAQFKYENLYKWQMYNVSVGVTDDFFMALQNNAEWKFMWGGVEWLLHTVEFSRLNFDGTTTRSTFDVIADSDSTAIWKVRRKVPYPTANDKFSVLSKRSVKASEVWDRLCYNAWADGCPGLLNLSTLRKMHNLEYARPISATNPCLHGDSLILTEMGLKQIRLIEGQPTRIWNGQSWSDSVITKTGVKPVYEMRLSNGLSVKGSLDHRFSRYHYTQDGQAPEDWVNLGESLGYPLEILLGSDWVGSESGLTAEQLIAVGFLFGNASYHKASNRYKYVHIGDRDGDVETFLRELGEGLEDGGREDKRLISASLAELCDKLQMPPAPLPDRELPLRIIQLPPAELCFFLKGLFSANGCVHIKYDRISLKGTCRSTIDRLQITLLALGIKSYTTTNKKHKVVFENGEYLCKESYDLNITSDDILVFQKRIGFIQEYKTKDLALVSSHLKKSRRIRPKVVAIKYVGDEFVYDFTEPVNHFGSVNGLKCHNCGEQPLPDFGSCLLGSLVLPSFVKDKRIDWEKLEFVVKTAVRFMDNVIDNCDFPLEEIKKAQLSERRIGLGTMGIHDMLIELGLSYASNEGRDVAESVLEFIRDSAYNASIELAIEKGSFPLFNKDKFSQSDFVKTLPKELQDRIISFGIRNCTVLSQAPTGTIGTMYGVSTGCEPWFALAFQRNSRLGSYEDGCQAFLRWRKENPNKETIPPYFITAQEISPEDHIKMMILFSKYTDSSVSKTVNLPNSATVEDVKKAFLYAMENGVKGITVFRDGCKEAVLVNKDNKDPVPVEQPQEFPEQEGEEKSHFKKRGGRTTGATSRIHLDGHNMYVTVNRNQDGDLVEVFATVGESKSPVTRHTSGIEDSWAEGLGKIVSLALRAGVNPESIVRNLKNIPSDKPVFTTVGDCDNSELIPSPPHAIGRVLEEELKYQNNTQIKIEPKVNGTCDSCGSTNINPKSPTCYECKDCGYSRCG